jgi:hypothetical protein
MTDFPCVESSRRHSCAQSLSHFAGLISPSASDVDLVLGHSIDSKRRFMSSLPSLVQFLDEDPCVGNPFEQLVIIGAPPLAAFESPPSPTVLLVHPATPLSIPAIEFTRLPYFCFPGGFEQRVKSKPTKHPIRDQFVFEIGVSSGTRMYGVCTVCSFAFSRPSFLYTNCSRQYPHCICYLTSNLVLAAQFHYESFLIGLISGSITSSVRHSPDVDFPISGGITPIPGLVRAGVVQRHRSFKVPHVLLHELCYFHSIECDAMIDRPILLAKKDSVMIPSLVNAPNCLGYVALDALFSVLSVENIVRLFSIFLLERRIILTSNRLHVLTMSALMIRDLLKPFKYRGTFLPILPLTDEFLPLLDSPVPFVCGILKSHRTVPFPSFACVVDLDRDSIRDPDNSPLVAGGEELINKINTLLEQNASAITVPPSTYWLDGECERNPEHREFISAHLHPFSALVSFRLVERKYIFGQVMVNEIAKLFRLRLAPVLETILPPCFVTDRTDEDNPITVFNKEVFVDCLDEVDRPFYRAFLGTSMFQDFADGLMEERMRDAMSRSSSKFSSSDDFSSAERLDLM